MPVTLKTVLLLSASDVLTTHFAVSFTHQPLKFDPWAGLCILGAVYFIFRA